MKKDRNCDMNYQVYPGFNNMPFNTMGNFMPIPGPMPGPIPASMQAPMPYQSSTNYYVGNDDSLEISKLKDQIQNLERRVSRLESISNNKNTFGVSDAYSGSYHVM